MLEAEAIAHYSVAFLGHQKHGVVGTQDVVKRVPKRSSLYLDEVATVQDRIPDRSAARPGTFTRCTAAGNGSVCSAASICARVPA